MDNINVILAVCIIVPLILIFLILDRNAKMITGFMILGVCMSLLVSECNTMLMGVFHNDMYYITTTISPMIEELIKALPILCVALLYSDEWEVLMPVSMAIGIGFAFFENLTIFAKDINTVSVLWVVARGLGSGLMQAVCSMIVAIGISFVYKKKKLFYTGTFGLLTVAIIYHAIFNCLVQSDYKYAGLLLPLVVFILIFVRWNKKKSI